MTVIPSTLPLPSRKSYPEHDPLSRAKGIAASGMDAQIKRLQTISENLANANVTAADPNSDPYRRMIVRFKHDQVTGKVYAIGTSPDPSDFRREHSPLDPGADEKGFVKMSNVNPLIEMADLRQADQSFSACLKAYEAAVDLDKKIIDMLKA
ncbi:MAG: flagellar basal body protein [Holosporales bacterium]|nr:flagellar basal body protein [Holosporales bacterium]